MRRVDRQRFLILRERFVRAADVPERGAEIGAHVDVGRVERERLLIETDRFGVATCAGCAWRSS